jgi:hypothetical protein
VAKFVKVQTPSHDSVEPDFGDEAASNILVVRISGAKESEMP